MAFRLDEIKTLNHYLSDIWQDADLRKHKENIRIMSGRGGRYATYPVSRLLCGRNEKKSIKSLDKILGFFSRKDLYITPNTFQISGKKKKNSVERENLFNVYTFCIDVDYKKGINHDSPVSTAVRYALDLCEDSFENLLPWPSYIEYGYNFRLIYCIKGHLGSEKQFRAIEKVAGRIVKNLNSCKEFDFHAEFQPLNSYIRMPGSYNGKPGADNAVVQLYKVQPVYDGCPVDIDTRKTLSEYMEEVLGAYDENAEKTERKIFSKSSKKHPAKARELNALRIEDIRKIRRFYSDSGEETGHRNNLCFAYFIHAKQCFGGADRAFGALERFNAEFKYPLSDGELKNCVCTAMEKDYFMKNETLLNFLAVTEELAEYLHLNLAGKTVGNAASCRKYREKKKRERFQKTREWKTSQAEKTIIRLKKKGFSNAKTAHICKLSIKSVERYVSNLKDGSKTVKSDTYFAAQTKR